MWVLDVGSERRVARGGVARGGVPQGMPQAAEVLEKATT